MTVQRALEITELSDTDICFLEKKYNTAIVGVTAQNKIVYSFEKIKKILEKEMTEEEAIEHITFNIMGAIGDNLPICIFTE